MPSVAWAQCNSAPQTLPNIPTQLSNFFVITADQTFTDATFSEPAWGGLFDANVMGRTPTQQEDRRQEAIAFFNSRFGVDFSAADAVDFNDDTITDWWDTTDGRFRLRYYMTPDAVDAADGMPDANFGQRVVYSGGDTVPAAGWPVREAYYKMEAIDTVSGHFLAGTYVSSSEVQTAYPGATSVPVLPGTFAVFGEYRIVTDYSPPCDQYIDLQYSSIRPTYPDVFATSLSSLGLSPTATLDYDVVFNPDNSTTGIARGTASLISNSPSFQSRVRMIIKFTP